jgi:transcription initiation factor TFIIB
VVYVRQSNKRIMKTSIACPVCRNGRRIITDSESCEIICSNCGIVISDNALDIAQSEWCATGDEEINDKLRTGIRSSLARFDMGLSTIIGRTDRDASGNILDATMRSRMQRLRTWDIRSQAQSSAAKNRKQAFTQLSLLKDKLNLSDAVIEKTAYIYRKAQERLLIRGRTISGMLAAAIYIACREMGTPRTLNDIATVNNMKRKELARNYRLLYFELDLRIPIIDPMKCIVKVANKANLTENTKRQALDIMRQAIKKEISAGKDPMGLAAAILYISCLMTGENTTQSDVARASGKTEVTIRNRFTELKGKLHLS